MNRKLGPFLGGVLLLAISGCWDIRDVNHTTFALAMGIDQPVSTSTAKYRITLEFAKPVPGRPLPESLVSSAEGDSALQAIQRIQTGLNRTISLSHLRVLIIGEAIARRLDFNTLSNFLIKEPEVALRLRLLFVQGNNKVRALFHTRRNFDRLLASELVEMEKLRRELALVRTNHFYNFWRDLKNNQGVALGSRVLLKEGKIVREGAAIYQNWKLAAWLNYAEVQAANWLVDKNRAVVVVKAGEASYTYRVSQQKIRITPILKNNKLSFLVKVTTDGMVMEEAGIHRDFSKEQNLKKVASLFGKMIRRQAEAAIAKAQHELKADYLGFGAVLKQHRPETFQALNWKEVFPTVPVKVAIVCKVSAAGL
jgi:spore germination protein KC